ncbi:hypothetical protein [Xanthomonas perforans]|uniref:hypothetical protein n=1 Tax=Xanthomonas perforans TaxID=442694 RepID=UPI000F8EFB29|nr:hypothetical protein [Xanthomonas perforans]MDC9654593.1 hypothetical protein [Xanthomonas perforans]MDC9655270.1 hypothetical protein [Xanthomonas perforans]MDC9677000.1 hypothetical protein [Xanthomonas perforans]MDC9680984.1 hypothetical protein [Xanthomonas perforans]MDC9685203.1 hypothetical protein [Xanthomonas perforans]
MDAQPLALIGASALTVAFGLLRVAIWILDRRADAALRAHREQVFLIESVLEHGAPLSQRRAVVSTPYCELELVA